MFKKAQARPFLAIDASIQYGICTSLIILLGTVLTIPVALTPLFLQTDWQFVHFGSSTGPKPAYYSKAWNPSAQQENG
jgi:hypothetical protein